MGTGVIKSVAIVTSRGKNFLDKTEVVKKIDLVQIGPMLGALARTNVWEDSKAKIDEGLT